MLGEKVGTMSGPTSLTALPATNGNPPFEPSAIGLTGTLAGAEVQSHDVSFVRIMSRLVPSCPEVSKQRGDCE